MNEVIETTATEITDVPGAQKLANEINAIKRQTMRTVLMASIEIGEKLCEAKALVAHGEWERWLYDNVDYSQSTANNLMKIYREYGDNQLDLFSAKPKSEIFGELSYSQAVALFALPAHERESFVEDHDMSAMSVRELNEEIERLKAEKDTYADKLSDTERKLDAAEEELETAKDDLADARTELTDTAADLKDKVKSAEARAKEAEEALEELKRITDEASAPKQISLDDVPEEELEKYRAEIAEKIEAEYKALNEQIAEKAKADVRGVAKVKDDQIHVALQRIEAASERIKELEAEQAKLEEQAKRGSGDAAVQQFAALFEAFQEDFNRLYTKLSAFESTDAELGGRMRTALGKIIASMADRIGG